MRTGPAAGRRAALCIGRRPGELGSCAGIDGGWIGRQRDGRRGRSARTTASATAGGQRNGRKRDYCSASRPAAPTQFHCVLLGAESLVLCVSVVPGKAVYKECPIEQCNG